MNVEASYLPHPAGATRLSEPSFDILRAVSDARQAALPTVRMLRARARDERHSARVNAIAHFLVAADARPEQSAIRPFRFFDLSDDANALAETMKSPFTRGFQVMLNPADLQAWSSVDPIPHEDNME